MIGCFAETDVLFTCRKPVMKGCIVCIRRPRETIYVIDLEVVTEGVSGVTVKTNH